MVLKTEKLEWASEDSDNESVFGAAAATFDRLVLGAPRKQSVFVRVKTRDAINERSLSVDADYATITLATQELSSRRKLLTRYAPIFYGKASFAQGYDEPIEYSALIPALDEEITGAVRNVGSMAAGDRPLFAQTPYRGDLTVQLSLMASNSQELIKTVMGATSELKSAFTGKGGGYDDYGDMGSSEGIDIGDEGVSLDLQGAASVARKAMGALMPERALFLAGTAAMKAFASLDGTWEPRVEHARPWRDLQTGHYALIQRKSDKDDLSDLEYDPELQTLLLKGRPLRRRDYVVLRVDASNRKQNIQNLPGVGQAFDALEQVFVSGGNVDAVFEKFHRSVHTSRFLTEKDKTELVQRVKQRYDSFKFAAQSKATQSELETGSNLMSYQNETLLDDLTAQFPALKTVQDIWSAASDIYELVQKYTPKNAPGQGGPATPGTPMTLPPQEDIDIVAPQTFPIDESSPPAVPAPPDFTETPEPPPQIVSAPVAAPDPTPTPVVPTNPIEEEHSVFEPEDRFATALRFALRWEGGFSDHPADTGGRTNHGITERNYHAWLSARGEALKPVEQIDQDEVHAIYYSNYWLTARCPSFSPDVDRLQFDAAVNHGPGGAGRILQRALRDAGQAITVDGAVGPMTIAASQNVDSQILSRLYIDQRRDLYRRIVAKNASQEVFLKGWLNRVNDLENDLDLSDNETAFGVVEAENTAFAAWVD